MSFDSIPSNIKCEVLHLTSSALEEPSTVDIPAAQELTKQSTSRQYWTTDYA